MAANFWVSSQYEEWTKGQSFDKLNEEDQKRVSERKRKDAEIFGSDSMEEDIKRLRVHLANTITCIGKKVNVRQRVISTAIVYLARFFFYNSYKEFHPHLIAATALYLASKVEESPVTPKIIVSTFERVFTRDPILKLHRCPFTINDIVDAEYFLVEQVKFNLIVFHPYRQAEKLIKDAEMEGKMQGLNLEHTYKMINDSYRTDVCLHFAPHTIAIAVIIMAALWNGHHTWENWYNELNFHENHKAQVKQVQTMLLQLYDEYECLEDSDYEKILEKIPRHLAGSQTGGASLSPANVPSPA